MNGSWDRTRGLGWQTRAIGYWPHDIEDHVRSERGREIWCIQATRPGCVVRDCTTEHWQCINRSLYWRDGCERVRESKVEISLSRHSILQNVRRLSNCVLAVQHAVTATSCKRGQLQLNRRYRIPMKPGSLVNFFSDVHWKSTEVTLALSWSISKKFEFYSHITPVASRIFSSLVVHCCGNNFTRRVQPVSFR
jgi:hypothetical protein